MNFTGWDNHDNDLVPFLCQTIIEAEWRIYAAVNYATIGSDNGLSPVRRQTIIWNNAGILLIRP